MAFSIKNFRYGLPKEEEKPVKIKEFTIKEAPLRQPSGLSLSQIDALQDRKAYELEQKESIPYQAPIQPEKTFWEKLRTGDFRSEAQREAEQGLTTQQRVMLGIEEGTREQREQANILAASTPQGVFAQNFWEGMSFGGSTLAFTDKEREAQKQASSENVGLAMAGQLAGSILPQAKLYSVVNNAVKGTALGARIASLGGAKAFAGSQGVQLLADTIIQSPREILEAIEEDKTLGQAAKDFAINRAIDVGMNLAIDGAGIGANKIKEIISNKTTRNVLKSQGVDVDMVTKAINDGDYKQAQSLMSVRTQQPSVTPRLAPEMPKVEEPTPSVFNQVEVPKVESPTIMPLKQAEAPRVETTIEPPKPKSILEKIQEPIEEIVDDRLLKKFRLDLFGATKEKPVDAIVDGVEKRVISVFDNEQGVKIAKLNDGTEVSFDSIKPSKKYTPFVSDDMQINVFEKATELKDIGTTTRYTTDVFRNFERVFDKNSQAFKTVKKNLLDPFDNAKGNMADDVIKLTDELDEVVVKGLGIKPKSKESKLVMRFGEGRIDYDGLVNEVGPEKAVKIVEADQFFRRKYDQLLDEININRINMNKPIIEKRQDYYRHYNDIANTFESIKNIIESGRAIDPKLSGLSEFTRPREAWASFKQRRTDGTKFTEDAVGGFLDYIRAGTYAKHIDPVISEFRSFRNTLANETTESRNLNRFIEYLDDFTNDLAGKTNPFDRWIQKLIGREGLALLNTVNSRVKANAVLGNLSSSVSQIANVPQGIATIKDPQALTLGLKNFMESIGGGGDSKLYKQSSFLKERYLNDAYSKFDRRLIDQPKKTAAWLLGALDEVGTKYIWSSAHAKALKEGIENPIKYADDLTRKMVGGRGIGEVPLAQKSNLTQLIAPFTLEVNNLWKVMQDMGKDKDIAGLTMLFVANYGLNRAIEEIRGSDVTFDPINAILEGYDRNEDFSDNITNVGGSLLGEALSNLPFGAAIGSVYPEYGARIGDIEFPTRAELFGESDPTRYGISVPLVRAVQDPAKNLLLPWGGGQVSKTIKGAQTMGLLPQNILSESGEKESITMPASVSASGKIRTLVEPSLPKTAQALAFGGYASPEVREFFEGTGVPFGENQTPKIIQLVQEGFDSQKLQQALTKGRKVTKKDERRKILEDSGFSPIEVNRIMEVFYGYKVD